jgi:integrase
MPRQPAWPPPVYDRAGTDYVRFNLGPGRVREVSLGAHGSAGARAEYVRLVAEVEAVGVRVALAETATTCLELCVAHVKWAEGYHEPRQVHRIRTALKPVAELYGRRPVASFGPVALKTCRDRLVAADYCRTYVNTLVNCVRGCFRWGVEAELVPAAVLAALAETAPLRKHKTGARERERVRPAKLDVVEATLPHMPPVVADMCRVLLYTGMRPGELCAMRPCDVDRRWKDFGGVPVWLYVLDEHKTDWKGHRREVAVGPRAQAVLLPYLEGRATDAWCFSPEEVARWWWRQAGRAYPERRRTRRPGRRYNATALGAVVRRACDRAGVARWSPGQLRHTAGTAVEVRYGREDARCVLGHTEPTVTAVYAEWTERAARVMAEMG